MQQAIQQARRDYTAARTVYGMVCHTDREAVAYHQMQAAWERLRTAIRDAKREAAPGEAAKPENR